MNQAQELLKKIWGHDAFRGNQSDIIEAVLQGKDVLALMPTGGGKSICFQIPAMLRDGVCLVVTPLIALMKDQVEQLLKRDIPAAAIHTGMNRDEVENVMDQVYKGEIQFLYVSPERLESRRFRDLLSGTSLSLIAVDEAHCISQWGYDFRPSYTKIANIRDSFPSTPVIALTASATRKVQEDICRQLRFGQSYQVFRQSFHRPNISYRVEFPASRQARMLEWIKQHPKCSAIIYTRNRKQTVQVAEMLNQHGILADHYHAGLEPELRTQKQRDWIENRNHVMVCTNAFGMGIDKPDVRLVIHLSVPESLEYYYQEAGRAGRDGNPATAVLLAATQDFISLENMHALRYPDAETIQKLYFNLMDFFQLPAGIGAGQRFSIDIEVFSERFGWNAQQVAYAIKTMEQCGFFFLSEGYLRPSSLVFKADRFTLTEMEKQEPRTEALIKALLRTYEGILEYPASIRETWLAKQTSTPIGMLREQLKWLHQHGIVTYRPASDKPEIFLLLNRMYRDDFKIDKQGINLRKQENMERIHTMIRYTQNESTCRSVFIGSYFEDHEIIACGKCDVCQEKSAPEIDPDIFIKKILSLSKAGRISRETIQHQFPEIPENKWRGWLLPLIEEGLLRVEK